MLNISSESVMHKFALLLCCMLSACSLNPAVISERAESVFIATSAAAAGGTTAVCVESEKMVLTKKLDPASIQLISWNLLKGRLPGWADDLARVSESSDLMLLQEVPANKPMAGFLSDTWYWRFAPGFNSLQGQTGVLTAAVASDFRYCTAKHKEPWLRSPKASLVTFYELTAYGETLAVANLHGVNITFGVRAYRRQLEAVVEVLKAHQGPVIVAGDFNTWSKRRSDTADDLLGPLGLRAVDFDADGRIMKFGLALDHVYYRGLDLVGHKVHKVTSSDHNPIQANFSLKSMRE